MLSSRLRDKIVIGTWPLSGDYGHVDPRIIQETLEFCYANDLKEFDTAPSYGNGFIEHFLGKVFVKKTDILINTKIGNLPFLGKNFSIPNMRSSLEQSLKRLSIDAVNILFLHNPRDEIKDFGNVLDFMDSLKKEGKIKYKGISLAKNHNYDIDFLNSFDVVQDDGNLLDMRFLTLKLSNSTRFMARSLLASGILSGQLNQKSAFPDDDHRSGWLHGNRLNSICKRVAKITDTFDIDLIDLSKIFVLSNTSVSKAIFGVKNSMHVESILNTTEESKFNHNIEMDLIKLYSNDFGLVGEKHLSV